MIEGRKIKGGLYTFGNYKGLLIYINENKDITKICSDKAFYNSGFSVHTIDNEEDKEMPDSSFHLKSSFALIAAKNKDIKYINLLPVYKREDGSVYTEFSGPWGLVDEMSERTIRDEVKKDINGKIIREKSSVKIKLVVTGILKSITIREMDGRNMLIRKSIFTKRPENIRYRLNNLADYLIVEERYIDGKNKEYLKRYLYDYGEYADHIAIKAKNTNNLFSHPCLFSSGKRQIIPMKINFYG